MPTYATWNPADKGTGVTLSNGNLTIVGTGVSQNFARSTIGKSSGKWYWEVKAESTLAVIGVTSASTPFTDTDFVAGATGGFAYYGGDGKAYTANNAGHVYGATFTTNDV